MPAVSVIGLVAGFTSGSGASISGSSVGLGASTGVTGTLSVGVVVVVVSVGAGGADGVTGLLAGEALLSAALLRVTTVNV